jgi:hypothetical protein
MFIHVVVVIVIGLSDVVCFAVERTLGRDNVFFKENLGLVRDGFLGPIR